MRFGGIYIEHSPKFRVVVRLVGGAEQLLSRYTSNPLIVAEKAAQPLVALRNKQEAAIKALAASEPNFGTEVDVRKGRLAIYAPSPDRGRYTERTQIYALMTAIRDAGRVYSFAGRETSGRIDLGGCAAGA